MTVRADGVAFAVLAEALGAPVPRPFAKHVTRAEVTLTGVLDGVASHVTGHLYLPSERAPAIVLLPGAAPAGKDDPRVARLARALARAGRVVFVPDLRLAHARFEEPDLDRIATAVLALRRRPDVRGRVALLGFSFGGSFALLAAADPRVRTEIAAVATFGSYFDILGVIQAASTGVSVVAGQRVPWTADPRAKDVLREVAVQFTDLAERAVLRAALHDEADPRLLPPGARAAYELVTNADPERTYALAGHLDATGRTLVTRFSPAAVAGAITAPVYALHSEDDPAVPFGELHRLARGLPHARTMAVRSFRHVSLHGGGRRRDLLRDLMTTTRLAGLLLAAEDRPTLDR